MLKHSLLLIALLISSVSNAQNTLNNIGLTASTPAASAYSLRQLSSSYTASAIQVRRSSDNTTQDIGFTGGGDLDTASLKIFVGANNGFVSIWYDQSGNGRNLTQPTTSRQSTIVSNGVIYRRNFKPTTYYDASDDGMLYSGSNYLTSNPISVNIVAGSNSSNAGLRRAVQGTTNWLIGPYTNTHGWFANGWNHLSGTPWSTSLAEIFTVIQPSSGSCTSWRNGVSQTTSNNNGTPNKIQTGVEGTFFEILDGYISEILTFNSALSTTDRQNLESNQTTYYSSTAISTDATLSALTTTAGTIVPSFASSTTAYTASVSNATTSVTVTPTKAQTNATIEVRINNGSYATVASASASSALSLNVGANPIDVRVTAQDGTTIKTYTITVTRACAPSASTTNVTICSNQIPYTWNSNSYNTAGTYNVTLANSVGCDSVATLNLTINSTSSSTTNATICSSQLPYSWNGTNYNASGTYTYTTTNSVGCDSIATLNLTVNASPTVTVTPSGATSFCSGDSVTLSASLNDTYLWSNGA
ncbi:MAG: cadherin-like beta sandwich domain-containing protein, partial [Dolichospermum sp.]